jgi:hypothetical protein
VALYLQFPRIYAGGPLFNTVYHINDIKVNGEIREGDKGTKGIKEK